MEADEFVDALQTSDLDSLLNDEMDQFLDFVREEIDQGGKHVILRCSLEAEDEGSIFPFYVWVVYDILMQNGHFALTARDFFLPKEGEFESYYCTPNRLKDSKFFPVIIT